MATRPILSHRPDLKPGARSAALDYEIVQEQVAALGRLGRALEAALAALAEYEQINGARGTRRAELVQNASDALWYFIVQREAVGLRDPRPVIREYRVPAEVHNRMGAFGAKG
jgi:hypothetical protein